MAAGKKTNNENSKGSKGANTGAGGVRDGGVAKTKAKKAPSKLLDKGAAPSKLLDKGAAPSKLLEVTRKSQDTVMTEETREKLLQSIEVIRMKNELTLKLEAYEKLQLAVKNGEMTQEEATAQLRKEEWKIRRMAMNEADPENYRGEDEPALLVGSKVVPKRGQISTTIDPYKHTAINVGILPQARNWVAVKIRFDYNHIFTVQRITVPAKNSVNQEIVFWSWTVQRVSYSFSHSFSFLSLTYFHASSAAGEKGTKIFLTPPSPRRASRSVAKSPLSPSCTWPFVTLSARAPRRLLGQPSRT